MYKLVLESFVLLKNTLKKVFKRNLLSLQGKGIEALNWSLVSVSVITRQANFTHS